MSQKIEKAFFGAGCFWGVEAILKKLEGVQSTEVGYMGGIIQNPSYSQVSTGKTGHAEVVRVDFDPKTIDYMTLLDYFWRLHDPTTPNQQGPNLGTQYRSVIFYSNDQQRRQAEASKEELKESGVYNKAIITEIVPETSFYPAEEYHQDYYGKNGGPICHVLRPE